MEEDKTETNMLESTLKGETGLGYVKRDNGVKTEEEQGLIEF